jgi:hypothetical protein
MEEKVVKGMVAVAGLFCGAFKFEAGRRRDD